MDECYLQSYKEKKNYQNLSSKRVSLLPELLPFMAGMTFLFC